MSIGFPHRIDISRFKEKERPESVEFRVKGPYFVEDPEIPYIQYNVDVPTQYKKEDIKVGYLKIDDKTEIILSAPGFEKRIPLNSDIAKQVTAEVTLKSCEGGVATIRLPKRIKKDN